MISAVKVPVGQGPPVAETIIPAAMKSSMIRYRLT
jgi:hypothetical protein